MIIDLDGMIVKVCLLIMFVVVGVSGNNSIRMLVFVKVL